MPEKEVLEIADKAKIIVNEHEFLTHGDGPSNREPSLCAKRTVRVCEYDLIKTEQKDKEYITGNENEQIEEFFEVYRFCTAAGFAGSERILSASAVYPLL